MSETTLTTPALPENDVTRQLQLRLQGLRSQPNSEQGKEAKLKKVCQDFEAVFVGQIWKQMRSSVPKDGLLHSKEEESYLSMFDQELSVKMAQGGGIGLGDMLQASLAERLATASKDTASSTPLLPLDKSALAANPSPLAQTQTLAARAAQHQAEDLARRIEQDHGGTMASVETPPNPVKVTLSELENALKTVSLGAADKI